MSPETPSHHMSCPKCRRIISTDSRFCKYCAFELGKVFEDNQTLSTDKFSQGNLCPKCGAAVGAKATFCGHCGEAISRASEGVVAGGSNQNVKVLLLVCSLLVIVGIVSLLLSLSGKSESYSSSTALGNSYTMNTSRTTVTSSQTTESNTGKLTNAKVENAVSRLLSNLLVGGSITVEGIQEQPQENAATADLRFNGFQYKSDMAGTPVTKDRRAPEEPKINDPNFYDKMYKYGTQQIQTRSYSGRGVGVLKRYNDGRWVLKEVHWEFNAWVGTVDIQ